VGWEYGSPGASPSSGTSNNKQQPSKQKTYPIAAGLNLRIAKRT